MSEEREQSIQDLQISQLRTQVRVTSLGTAANLLAETQDTDQVLEAAKRFEDYILNS